MPYGILKVDTITFTAGGVDTSVSISGLVRNPTFTGNITSTGTISGNIIRGGTTVSGATVTGTAGQFGTLTGNTAGFTTVTGVTVTGTTANFVTVSGTTVTGTAARFTNVTGVNIIGTTTVSGATVTGNAGQFTTATVTSGVFASGTAAAPSVSVGTTTNGLYSSGANEVAISTNGTGRLTIDSSGNVNIDSNTLYVDATNNRVGVGTSSPDRQLTIAGAAVSGTQVHINSTSSSAGIKFSPSSGDAYEIQSGTDSKFSLYNRTDEAYRITVDGAGNVGVGNTAPGSALTVSTIGSVLSGTGNTYGFYINPVSTGYVYLDALTGSTSNTSIVIRTYNNGTYNNVIQSISGNETTFSTAGNERARIDSSGRLLVGTSSARSNLYTGSLSAALQVEGTTYSNSALSLVANGATSAQNPYSILYFGRSRGATVGSNTIVASGDQVGAVVFTGADGTNLIPTAAIESYVDGTPGANDMPGRLVFSTTADGASSPTERMRISSTGQISSLASSSAGITGAGAALTAQNNSSATSGVAGICSSLGTAGSANNTNCTHFTGITQGVAYYYLYGNGTSSFTSDARKKKNIETTRDGYLEDLSRLRVVKYNWINQNDGDSKELGLIAQEVEEVFPGLVQEGGQLEGDDFNSKVLKGSVLPFMLLKALQEAAKRIEALEAEVATLKTQ